MPVCFSREPIRIPCGCVPPSRVGLELPKEPAGKSRADAAADMARQACHTCAVESFSAGAFVRDRLGPPCLKVEADYGPDDRERLGVRTQILLEMVR